MSAASGFGAQRPLRKTEMEWGRCGFRILAGAEPTPWGPWRTGTKAGERRLRRFPHAPRNRHGINGLSSRPGAGGVLSFGEFFTISARVACDVRSRSDDAIVIGAGPIALSDRASAGFGRCCSWLPRPGRKGLPALSDFREGCAPPFRAAMGRRRRPPVSGVRRVSGRPGPSSASGKVSNFQCAQGTGHKRIRRPVTP